jgi:hypothetical protein
MSSHRPARERRALVVGALALSAVALAGCSGGVSSSSAGVSEAAMPGAVDAVSGAGGTAYDAAKAPDGLTGIAVTRDVVVQADIAVRVEDVTASTARLASVAAAHRAIVASQSTSDGQVPLPVPVDRAGAKTSTDYCTQNGCPGGYATSVTTLRVANSEVDALLRDLRALGTVASSSRTAEDVTATVADVGARVASARASLTRVRLLMNRATSLADVVTLEAEMGKRQADLEALEAQQRALADQTALATVSVTLTSSAAPVPAAEDTGFLAGLHAGWSAFTGAMVVGLTVIGAVLPFLVVLGAIGLLVWWWRRRRTTPAEPTPAMEMSDVL